MRDDVAIHRLLLDQDGHVTRGQVLAHGGTDEWLKAQVAALRWVRVGRKVYRGTTGPPTPRQEERAALLSAGPVAALSHGSAARRWGPGRPDRRVHITVPYGKSADQRPLAVVHRSRAFAHIVVDDSDLPTVSAADTCVDLALLAPDPRAGMRMLLHVALGMRVSAARLLAVLERRPPPRYRRALRDAARYLEEGVESHLESSYAVDVEDAHGLPRARRQAPLDVEGVARYEDCLYVLPGGSLIVRLDGWRYHSDRRAARVDRARDNAAELAGRSRLTFGWEEVNGCPCDTAALVTAGLRRLGWLGPSGPVSCACVPVP